MPSRNNNTNETVSHNIEKLVHNWKKSGKIGTSRPRSKKKAIKQAVAISMRAMREADKLKYNKYDASAVKKPPKKLP